MILLPRHHIYGNYEYSVVGSGPREKVGVLHQGSKILDVLSHRREFRTHVVDGAQLRGIARKAVVDGLKKEGWKVHENFGHGYFAEKGGYINLPDDSPAARRLRASVLASSGLSPEAKAEYARRTVPKRRG